MLRLETAINPILGKDISGEFNPQGVYTETHQGLPPSLSGSFKIALCPAASCKRS